MVLLYLRQTLSVVMGIRCDVGRRVHFDLQFYLFLFFFFFQAEHGIRDLVRSRGRGDVYKRQADHGSHAETSLSTRGRLFPQRSIASTAGQRPFPLVEKGFCRARTPVKYLSLIHI